ncbi:hypothetical protein GCM10022254_40410 [Actinomadura meridiana]|uniref:Uncharacterized protein n=1 Tax=Actinomadura meridiana TaxID=559626 RepID=A0ABP8C6V2_9ACTN
MINPLGFVAVVFAFLILPCASVTVKDWSPLTTSDLSPFKAATEGSATGANIPFDHAFYQNDFSWPWALRLGTAVTVLVIAAGAGTGLFRSAERRLLRAAQVAAVAEVFLVLAVLSVASRMEETTYVVLANLVQLDDVSHFQITAGPEGGFWLSLIGLALIFAINLLALRIIRRRD